MFDLALAEALLECSLVLLQVDLIPEIGVCMAADLLLPIFQLGGEKRCRAKSCDKTDVCHCSR
jgi:hypothetical protein